VSQPVVEAEASAVLFWLSLEEGRLPHRPEAALGHAELCVVLLSFESDNQT